MGTTGESRVPVEASGSDLNQMLELFVRKRFEWRVQGCSRLVSATQGDEARLTYTRSSPRFRFMNRTWFLLLYPNIQPAMHLYLCLMDGDVPITVKVHFGIRKVHGPIEEKVQKSIRYVADKNLSYTFDYRGYKTLISKTELANRMSELVKDDVLTIVCSICTEECLDFFREFVFMNEASIPLHLLPESRPSNMMFIVRNVNMVVDYNILRVSCPNFASKVEAGGTYLLDYDPQDFRQFLLYLYTGKIIVKELKNLLSLLSLANSYKMDQLRHRCLCLIAALVVPDTAIRLLVIAESFKERDLMAVIYKFIFEHASQVLSSSLWMEFLKAYPLLANGICRLIGKTYKKRLGLSSSEEFCREALNFHRSQPSPHHTTEFGFEKLNCN